MKNGGRGAKRQSRLKREKAHLSMSAADDVSPRRVKLLEEENVRLRILLDELRVEGRPCFLIRNGRVNDAALRKESLAKDDLFTALRDKFGVHAIEVEWAVLETSGSISIKRVGGGIARVPERQN